jgi:hypothetical protein
MGNGFSASTHPRAEEDLLNAQAQISGGPAGACQTRWMVHRNAGLPEFFRRTFLSTIAVDKYVNNL